MTSETEFNTLFKIEAFGKEENEKLKDDFKGYIGGGVRIGPQGYFFQGNFENLAKDYYNFEVKDDDIFVATFARCGTTWTQEMVWLLVNNFDYKGAETLMERRFPFIDADSHIDVRSFARPEVRKHLTWATLPEEGHRLREAQNHPSPRCLKTHLPFSLMPKNTLEKCKVIYVARDPRDVVLSLYHHHSLIRSYGFNGSIDTFLDYFVNNKVINAPIWSHIEEAWNQRQHPNLLFLTFEEMKKDIKAVIRRVTHFLGKSIDKEDLEKLSEHLNFNSMKNNTAVNGQGDIDCGFMDGSKESFIRKGGSGGWREALTEEQREKLQKWFHQNSKELAEEFGWPAE